MAQTQRTKFIDVTRTFLPIDPNSFPETLHGASIEDNPENRVPVMAYKGYNFMPTSYGYKSFFGISQSLDIDTLPARCDAIFVYQNLAYKNVLVALTEAGIYTKVGSTVGAWTLRVAMDVPVDPLIHYEWTTTVIGNILYAYRENQPSYQKFVTDLALGVAITSIVPSFLNMAAQKGIFAAAGRLGFWDSDNSTGWSNLDDFSDFVPDLETLAGNIKFIDVKGNIVTIKAHGAGFIIYATKSIVFIAKDINNVYQWVSTPVIGAAGISYPRQCVEGSPDTTHYAWTSEGLKKIERGVAEPIITEVTDFFKPYQKPIYLSMLQGRYLAIEVIDDDYLTGAPQITEEVVPAIDYVFPGAGLSIEDSIPITEGAICVSLAGLNDGSFEQGQPFPAPVDQHPTNKAFTPVWTAYLSRKGVINADDLAFTVGDCPTVDPFGVDAQMAPVTLKLSEMTQNNTNKTVSNGSSAYVDGNWTIERFIAAQSAIWKAEDNAIKKVMEKATSRTKNVRKVTNNPVCVVQPIVKDECVLGTYATEYSPPKFGWSPCEFWLTRYATRSSKLIRVKTTQTLCGPLKVPDTAYWETNNVLYPSTSSTSAGCLTAYNASPNVDVVLNACLLSDALGNCVQYNTLTITGDPSPIVISRYGTLGYDRTEIMTAYNKEEQLTPNPAAIESAFCRITGWKYIKNDNTVGVVAAAACTSPQTVPTRPPLAPQYLGAYEVAISSKDGSFCGQPYTPPVIEGITIDWPSTSVTIPTGSFLLRDGSPSPIYPNFAGALVYDLFLKKWGKMRQPYRQLLDYSPINSSLNGVIPYERFGIVAGILGTDSKVYLFDQYPVDSYISYGKVGYYRHGKTSPEEVRVDFASQCTGYLKVEVSLNGKFLGAGLTKTEAFTNAETATIYGLSPGSWANIEIGGIFDINYLEYRGFIQGRR